VQNSDDNRYAPGVTPTLRIEIHRDRLAFHNNEEGFTEDNIVALCNIGASSKVAAAGYIGHKGIGFKSVFKVSRRPRVHSRTYHFEFDSDGAATDGFAYIIPTPLPFPPGWDPRSGTAIVLPFQVRPAPAAGCDPGAGDCGAQVFEMVRANVKDVESSLLLFLNRLKRIEILDSSQAKSHSRVMHRREEPDGVVSIVDSACDEDIRGEGGGAAAERWLVTSQILPTGIRRNERAGGDTTRLSIAVPMLPAAALLPGAPPPPPRDVFAFLPLRSYGFRWVLQGDFVVPSSREAVDASHPWNQMLLAAVPDLFVEAAMRLVDRAAAAAAAEAGSGGGGGGAVEVQAGRGGARTAIWSAASPEDAEGGARGAEDERAGAGWGEIYLLQLLFAMVPLPGQVSEFFAPVPRSIITRLRDRAIIPAAGTGYVRPCTAVHPLSPPGPADAYTARVLRRMGLHFVRGDVVVPVELARELGVRPLSALLCDVLQCAADAWAETPLASGSSASGSDGGDDGGGGDASGGGSGSAGRVQAGSGGGCGGHGAEVAADPLGGGLRAAAGAVGGGGGEVLEFDGAWLVQMLEALQRRGDCSTSLQTLRILPLFPLATRVARSEGLARLSEGEIFEVEGGLEQPLWHLAGLRVLCPKFRDELVRSGPAAAMARRLGLRGVDSEAFVVCHLIPAMAAPGLPAEALVHMLAAAKRVAAGAPGLQGGRLEGELLRAGALLVDSRGRALPAGSPLHFPPEYAPPDAPAVRASDIFPPPPAGEKGEDDRWPTVSGEYLKADGDRAGWFALLRGLGVSLFIRVDPAPAYSSPELAALLPPDGAAGAVGPSEAARLTRVAALLAQLWEREYRSLAAAADAAAADGSFVALLRRARWVVGTDGRLHAPEELYAPGALAARAVLGERAVLCVPGGAEGALAADLGVRADLSAKDLVAQIDAWAAAEEAVPLNLMARVYAFLARSLDEGGSGSDDGGKEALAALAEMRCVFVPERRAASALDAQRLRQLPDGLKAFALRDDGAPVAGQWLRPQDCVWRDASHLIDSLACWKRAADVVLCVGDAEHHLAASAMGCRALQAYYPAELARLLCGGGLGVAEAPRDEQYLDVWGAAAAVRPLTPPAVACVLRVCVHITYELEGRHRDWDCSADADAAPPLLLAVRARAASLHVPNASGVSLSPLAAVRWIADPERDQALLEGWFGPGLLEHCVPLRHSGLHGVFDARLAPVRPARGANAGLGDEPVCVGKLDERMEHLYSRVLRLPRLADALTRRIVCEAVPCGPGSAIGDPDSENSGGERVIGGEDEHGGPDDSGGAEAELGAAAGCALCHVAARTLQAWSAAAPAAAQESTAAAAAIAGDSGGAGMKQGRILADAVRRLRLRRVASVQMCEQWVAAAATGDGWTGNGGPAMEFVSRAVAPRQVTCGMDLADAGGPLLLAAGPSLAACAAEDVAAAFARLCCEVRLGGGGRRIVFFGLGSGSSAVSDDSRREYSRVYSRLESGIRREKKEEGAR
jgi:hypothetical protein